MDFVNTYTQWKAAIDAKFQRLYAVEEYLNDKGHALKRALFHLGSVSGFYKSASELVSEIDNDPDFLKKWNVDADIVSIQLQALKRIAENENNFGLSTLFY